MGRITNIETLIDKERKALYACAKAKCCECPLKSISTDCMIILLKNFNKIVDELMRQYYGKTLHKQRREKR